MHPYSVSVSISKVGLSHKKLPVSLDPLRQHRSSSQIEAKEIDRFSRGVKIVVLLLVGCFVPDLSSS